MRQIYEADFNPDDLEAEAFFAAFGKHHDLDGHNIECVITPPKHEKASSFNDGVHRVTHIIIVRETDARGFKVGGGLCVDGTDYRIAGLSKPLSNIFRLELESYSG